MLKLGRMKPGERVEESAARLIERELQISISQKERFSIVTHFSMVWNKRQQPPIENGTADISTFMTIQFKSEEISKIKFDTEEYSMVTWVSPTEILSDILFGKPYKYHSALRQAVSEYIAHLKWKEIELHVQSPTSSLTNEEWKSMLSSYIQFRNGNLLQ